MKTKKVGTGLEKAGLAEKNRRSLIHGAFFFLFAVTLLVPSIAGAARERYVLDFNDTFIRSYHKNPATIFLKRTLKAQYPGVNIRDMKLRKVVLVAKTKKGLGGAELRVGQDRSSNHRVYGNPWEFNDSGRYTFDRVRFRNPARDSHGPWQVNLWGNFVVRKIVLVVDENRNHRHHGRHEPARYWW